MHPTEQEAADEYPPGRPDHRLKRIVDCSSVQYLFYGRHDSEHDHQPRHDDLRVVQEYAPRHRTTVWAVAQPDCR
jgi:hypothetical protein